MRRTTKTLALPGDEDDVLDLMIREALRRDQCFTTAERVAYMAGRQCAELALRYRRWGGTWKCSLRQPCAWCGWATTKDN